MACKVQEKPLPQERNWSVNDSNRRRNHHSHKDNWYYSQCFENDDRPRFHHKNKQEYERYRGSFNRRQFKGSGTCNRSPRSWNNKYNEGRGSNFYEGEKRQNFRNFTKPLPPYRELKPAAVIYVWQNGSTAIANTPLPRDRYEKEEYKYSNHHRGHGKLNDTSYYLNNNRSRCQVNGRGINNFIFLVDSPNFKSERLQRYNNHTNGHRTRGQSLLQNSNYSRRPNWCFDPRTRHSICDNSWCYSENTHREYIPPCNKINSDSSNYASRQVQKNYNMLPTAYGSEKKSYRHHERTQNAWDRPLEKTNYNHHAYQREHGWHGRDYGPNMKPSHHNNTQAWRERNSNYRNKDASNTYTQESRKYSKPSFAEEQAKSSSRKKYVPSEQPPKQKFNHWISKNNKSKKRRRNIARKTGNKGDKADKTEGLRSTPRGIEFECKETDENTRAAIRCNFNKENQGSDFPHEEKLDMVGSSSWQDFQNIERFYSSKPVCVSSTTIENLPDVKESWNVPYEEYVSHAQLNEPASENYTSEIEISSIPCEIGSNEDKSPNDKRSSFTRKLTSLESELNSLTCEINLSEFKYPTSELKSSYNEINNEDVLSRKNSTSVIPAIRNTCNSNYSLVNDPEDTKNSLEIPGNCQEINAADPRLDKRGVISVEQSSSSLVNSQEVETKEVASELSTD